MSEKEYWTVERDREVVQYLVGLREIGAELRQAINSLHAGIPEDAYKIQDNPETWRWLEARHWITFIVDRSHNRRWLVVTTVLSATVK